MGAELILIPLPGLGTLALDHVEFDRARKRGAELLGATEPVSDQISAGEPLLDSAGLARYLGVPASWLSQAARDGRVPCVRVGRRVRFRRSEIEAALEKVRSPAPRLRVAK